MLPKPKSVQKILPQGLLHGCRHEHPPARAGRTRAISNRFSHSIADEQVWRLRSVTSHLADGLELREFEIPATPIT
jgi:hypothetical protein